MFSIIPNTHLSFICDCEIIPDTINGHNWSTTVQDGLQYEHSG